MCDQLRATETLITYLNRTMNRRYAIVATPDEDDSTRPRWDYTLEDAGSRHKIGLEVTTAHRGGDARWSDDMWNRIHDRVQEAARARVTGDFNIYTPVTIFVRRNTEEAVAEALTEAIVRMCNSGQAQTVETVQTPTAAVEIRVNRSRNTGQGLGFVRVTQQGAFLASMRSLLDETIVGKEHQLEAIIAEGLPPHLLIESIDFPVLRPHDVAQAALEIIRGRGLRWEKTYVLQLGNILTVDRVMGSISR